MLGRNTADFFFNVDFDLVCDCPALLSSCSVRLSDAGGENVPFGSTSVEVTTETAGRGVETKGGTDADGAAVADGVGVGNGAGDGEGQGLPVGSFWDSWIALIARVVPTTTLNGAKSVTRRVGEPMGVTMSTSSSGLFSTGEYWEASLGVTRVLVVVAGVGSSPCEIIPITEPFASLSPDVITMSGAESKSLAGTSIVDGALIIGSFGDIGLWLLSAMTDRIAVLAGLIGSRVVAEGMVKEVGLILPVVNLSIGSRI